VVVGAVAGSGGVKFPAERLDQSEVFAFSRVAAAFEHEVFEEVGESGPARHFVARPDAVPQVDRRHLPGGSRSSNQPETVVQSVLPDVSGRAVARHQSLYPLLSGCHVDHWAYSPRTADGYRRTAPSGHPLGLSATVAS